MKKPVLYAKEMRLGEWIAYERHPIPGGKDMALVCRGTKRKALAAARKFLKERREGSAFKAERSVVGA